MFLDPPDEPRDDDGAAREPSHGWRRRGAWSLEHGGAGATRRSPGAADDRTLTAGDSALAFYDADRGE